MFPLEQRPPTYSYSFRHPSFPLPLSAYNDDGSSFYFARDNFFIYGGGGLKNGAFDTKFHWLCGLALRPSTPFPFPRPFAPALSLTDFEGHDNIWTGNVVAFPGGPFLHNGYGGTVGAPGKGILDGHEQQFISNICIAGNDRASGYVLPICTGRGKTVLANNTIYTPAGVAGECGMPLKAWQALDPANDPGSVALPYPATLPTDIISWAKLALNA